MIYLAQYRTHKSVEDLNNSVSNHIYHNHDKLTKSDKAVLQCFAKHSLTHVGACHLKLATIAEEINVSIKTVQRAIKKLTDLHVIQVISNTRKGGQQGANIYSIQFFRTNNVHANVHEKMSKQVIHETPRISTVQHKFSNTESFNSFNLSFNPFVNKNVGNNVYACDTEQDLKSQLRAIYNPQSVEGNAAFEELCKIAFGRIKQYMKSHNMPYLQMTDIVTRCMKSLVNKKGVRNQFAMFSKMVERQVLQLFEPFKQPVQAFNQSSREIVPDWFVNRNEPQNEPQIQVNNSDIDFEAEQAKFLARLGV